MPAFQIIVERQSPHAATFPFPSPRGHKGLVDLLVDGANLTARLGRAEVVPLLRDLGLAISDLAAGRRARASISCLGGDEPWQLGVERAGPYALISLFRAGEAPEVAVHERRIEGSELLRGTAEAIAKMAREAGAQAELELAREALSDCRWPEGSLPETRTVEVSTDEDAPFHFSASLALREGHELQGDASIARSDLLGLLCRGSLRFSWGDKSFELGETFVYLIAERLIELSSQALDAWEQGRALYRRISVAGISLALRHEISRQKKAGGRRPTIWLTLGGSRDGKERNTQTFPAIDLRGFAWASVDFASSLIDELVQNERGHAHNLRLLSMQDALGELRERLEAESKESAKLNPAPESYRAYAAFSQLAEKKGREDRSPARLRFTPRWSAEVPGIDLRATFLCGDRLIVGSARETACLDRRSGHLLWKEPTSRALSVVTPAGLARIFVDGLVEIHDFGTGEIIRRLRIAPRVGGATSGAIVNAPGLPRLLVLTEGERYLSAIDLASFEVRFRHTARRGSSFRIRRAGRLLIVASGDPSLSALDISSGDVVFRVHDRMGFFTQAALEGDSLFALAGDPEHRRGLRLHHLDPYAGATHWVRELPAELSLTGAMLAAEEVIVLVTRDRHGEGLVALDRSSGKMRWQLESGSFAPGSAWLVVDDLLVQNGEDGIASAVEAESGDLRWQHVLRNPEDGEEPRRLEPILRSGALFLPQSTVHMIRPRDGEPLGALGCDLVPDLLRVDEECAVYVAEESGHIAAFEAGARLALVKG